MKNGFFRSIRGIIIMASVVFLGLAVWGYFLFNNMNSTINEEDSPMGMNSNGISVTTLTTPDSKRNTKTFDIQTQVKNINLGHGKQVEAWTFSGTSPGPEIRVKQGDRVVVHLKNDLPVALTIHWHGLDVPAAMDGVAGITQNAVKPGETYTYTFNADQVGTYWYHSHQMSAEQTERGLFGAIVIEPNTPIVQYEKDYTVAIHEWKSGVESSFDDRDHNRNDEEQSDINNEKYDNEDDREIDWNTPQSNMLVGALMKPTDDQLEELSDGDEYDVFTLNQTSEGLHLDAKPGERVRLRLINTSNNTHIMTLLGVPFQIIALDGRDIKGGSQLNQAILPIGAAQRYDLVFEMPKVGSVKLVNANPSTRMNSMLSATVGDGVSPKVPVNLKSYPWFDFTKYGQKGVGKFTIDSKFTQSLDMDLAEGKYGQQEWVYTINGKSGADIPPIQVKTGDTVKIRFRNKGVEIHPMHLHGHTFQVISKNGKAMEGSPIYTDTVNIFPGEEYEIALEANNSGLWMVHCHDLVHAEMGMHTMMNYEGVTTPFSTGEHSGNHPE
ncbi:multicopper oxidase family protein [Paenibacillus shirakamiensis]|nr:multicopper oxidase family protein [Paenibacillus shirakamiensis]